MSLGMQVPELDAALDAADPVALLAELVRTPSHPGVARQEEEVVAVLERYLGRWGLACTRTEVAPGRPNLVCTLRGAQPGPHLLLCGHTDTVPLNAADIGVGFSAEIRDGCMHGRGTVDMKGAIAAMAAALVALERTGALRAGAVTLAAVVDEEMQSLGAEHLVHSGFRADGAIVGEPSGNRLCLGHKGLEWLGIDFVGCAAHGGTPQAGVNAIVAAARLVQRVSDELLPGLAARPHPLLGPATINFGTIRGGDQPSTVAASCTLTLDRRTLPDESHASVCAELNQLLAVVERELPGLRTELYRLAGGMATLEHVACVTSAREPVARAVAAACESVRGAVDPPTAFAAWTDAALLSAFAGIPSVVLGPGDLALAHSPAEAVPLAEVVQAARIYAASALCFTEGA